MMDCVALVEKVADEVITPASNGTTVDGQCGDGDQKRRSWPPGSTLDNYLTFPNKQQ
jgi:hypothetical protein